jgi:hypothetical protein
MACVVPLRENGHMAGSANTGNTASPVETFRQFVTAINRHDVGALAAMALDNPASSGRGVVESGGGGAQRGKAERRNGGWQHSRRHF